MRKVFLKLFLLICFSFCVLGSVSVKAHASEPSSSEVVSGEDYIYIKVLICDRVFVFVYTIDWKIVQIFPEDCPPHGWH